MVMNTGLYGRDAGGTEGVARGGVEPPTFRFSVGRSYQLSYLAGAPSPRAKRVHTIPEGFAAPETDGRGPRAAHLGRRECSGVAPPPYAGARRTTVRAPIV
jgi:hypothetical protein